MVKSKYSESIQLIRMQESFYTKKYEEGVPMDNKLKRVKLTTLAEDYAGGGMGKCLAQHGVSFFISVENENGEVNNILFDTGDYHEPIIFNAEKLKISLENIETIVLSHSHYDHTGGLIGLMQRINKRELPIIAHPHIFKQSFFKEKPSLSVGMENKNTKEIVEKLGGVWRLTKEPVQVVSNVTFMGEIPRITDFEQELTINLQTEVNGEWVDDQIEDDSAIFIDTPKGLIIVSGCSHSGIVNITKYASKISGKKIHAVIGGFHLLSASEERIVRTAEALKDLGVDKVVAGHCTGLVAEYLFQQKFKDNFQKLYSGKIIEFSF